MTILSLVAASMFLLQSLRGQTSGVANSDSARVYLDKAISILERSAYYRERVDWGKTRDSCLSLAKNARRTADTYDAIRFALRCLGDHHSSLSTPDQMKQYASKTVPENPKPLVTVLSNGTGYIVMPGFGSLDGVQMLLYVADLCAQLDSVARIGVRGWVLDLRKNTGGNMWPMLAGLYRFLPSDTLGYFVNHDGNRYSWPRWRIGGSPPPVDASISASFQESPMAVIQGENTASSGEAVLIATKSRPHTRTFGRPTSGRSSANSIFWMPDGAAIMLTTALFADRGGHVYGGPIPPDVLVIGNEQTGDSALAAAVDWLSKCVR